MIKGMMQLSYDGRQKAETFHFTEKVAGGKDIVGTYKILKAMSKMNVELLFTKSYGTKIRGLSLQLALGLKKRQYSQYWPSGSGCYRWLWRQMVSAGSKQN